MAHAQAIAEVRNLVLGKFAELGLTGAELLRETLLVCDGSYCGRRFQADNGNAVWFFEEGQIKFFSADGSLAEVVLLRAAATPTQRLAA